MSRFSKKTMNILKQAGWYPNRRVDITEVINHATEQNIHIGENILSFLHEFFGLKFNYPDGKFLFEFCGYSSMSLIYINNMTGENSIEIGSIPDLLLAIGESGKMYAFGYFNGNQQHVFELSECYDEGIEFVCKHGLNPFPYLLKAT